MVDDRADVTDDLEGARDGLLFAGGSSIAFSRDEKP
jgi:hypothetical protein